MLSRKEWFLNFLGFLFQSILMFCFFFIARHKLTMDVWDVLILSMVSGLSVFIVPHRIKQEE